MDLERHDKYAAVDVAPSARRGCVCVCVCEPDPFPPADCWGITLYLPPGGLWGAQGEEQP